MLPLAAGLQTSTHQPPPPIPLSPPLPSETNSCSPHLASRFRQQTSAGRSSGGSANTWMCAPGNAGPPRTHACHVHSCVTMSSESSEGEGWQSLGQVSSGEGTTNDFGEYIELVPTIQRAHSNADCAGHVALAHQRPHTRTRANKSHTRSQTIMSLLCWLFMRFLFVRLFVRSFVCLLNFLSLLICQFVCVIFVCNHLVILSII